MSGEIGGDVSVLVKRGGRVWIGQQGRNLRSV